MISVIIPVYNHAAFVGDAVASVLAQTRPPTELLAVDDGSEDDSAARAEAAGARVLRLSHGGVSAALNAGIAATTQPLLAFLDADDVWIADKLERQVEQLGDHDAVFGWIEEFSALNVRCRTMPGYFKGTMLVRREVVERVGEFDPQWASGDFVDWFARAKDAGLRYAMLPDVVLRRRIHGSNLAGSRERDPGDYLRILKASLDRRRA